MLGLAAAAALARPATAQGGRGFAVIDWALLETALALGAVPAAATELRQFRQVAVEPTVPAGVQDLGLRGAPNYELLRLVAPELILISDFYEYQRRALERIAAVASFPVYRPDERPGALARETTLRLGSLLRLSTAKAYVADTDRQFATLRARLAAFSGRRIFVVSLGDFRHFRAFGPDSMFGDAVSALGLVNAWAEPTSYGAAAPVPVAALAADPGAAIAIVAPLPPEVDAQLAGNRIWDALPAVRAGRVIRIPATNHFGALPAARRFARFLAEALLSPVEALDG